MCEIDHRLTFSLESHADCAFDYVDVFDNNTLAYSNNDSSSLIGRFVEEFVDLLME